MLVTGQVTRKSSRPKVLVKSPEIVVKSVCNIPRSFSLDETKPARQMSNISCFQRFDDTKQAR